MYSAAKVKRIIVDDDDLSSCSPRKRGRPIRDSVMNDELNDLLNKSKNGYKKVKKGSTRLIFLTLY